MIKDFINSLKEFSKNDPYIESVIIVGSYARGTNKKSSDLDIVIITSNKTEMIKIRTLFKALESFYKNRQSVMVRVPLFVYGIKMGKRWSLEL